MKYLEIVFTKSKKKFPIIGWGIQLWTNKPYSHSAVKFNTSNYFGMNTFFQASDGMVNYMSETQFNKKHTVTSTKKVYVDSDVYREIRNSCHYEAGAKYGIMQNIGIVLVDILSIFGTKIDNPFKYGRNCSELIYIKIIVPMWGEQGYNPDTIKPHHIERILNEKLNESVL